LSPSSKLGTHEVRLSTVLDVAVKQNATPTVFIYGEQDTKGKDLATALEKRLKDKDNKYYYVRSYGVPGVKFAGSSLLLGTIKPKTSDAITGYLDEVIEKKSNEWAKRDFRTSQYIWQDSAGITQAKLPTEPNNLVYENYAKFSGKCPAPGSFFPPSPRRG